LVRDVACLDVSDDGVRITLQDVAVPASGALADHVDLAFVDEFETHSHVMRRVPSIWERPIVHQCLEVERPPARIVA
jgi:hypothetical protein